MKVENFGLMSHPGTVEILVKNPSGEGDSVLLVPLTSSILDLKHKIAEQHPKKPDVSSQRLIFSGRILRDDDVLQYIFNPNLVRTSPTSLHSIHFLTFPSMT